MLTAIVFRILNLHVYFKSIYLLSQMYNCTCFCLLIVKFGFILRSFQERVHLFGKDCILTSSIMCLFYQLLLVSSFKEDKRAVYVAYMWKIKMLKILLFF